MENLRIEKSDAFYLLSKTTGVSPDLLETQIESELLKFHFINDNDKFSNMSLQDIGNIHAVGPQRVLDIIFRDQYIKSQEAVISLSHIYFVKKILMTVVDKNKIVEGIPSIDLCLDWDGTEGRFKEEGKEIVSGPWILVFNIEAFESGYIIPGDWDNQEEFVSQKKEALIEDLTIYINDEDKVLMSDDLCEEIKSELISNLNF